MPECLLSLIFRGWLRIAFAVAAAAASAAVFKLIDSRRKKLFSDIKGICLIPDN